MKRLLFPLIAYSIIFSTSTFAQFEIGASYELRDEEPKSGFGIRVQKGFLQQIPLVDLGFRAHFSYFSEENNLTQNSISYSRELTNYDFGVDVIAGVNVGLIEPYAGVGLGSMTLDIKPEDVQGVSVEDENESNIYWNLTVGSKVAIIPLVKPFVEFRYSNASLSQPDVAELTTGRIIFGVVLSL